MGLQLGPESAEEKVGQSNPNEMCHYFVLFIKHISYCFCCMSLGGAMTSLTTGTERGLHLLGYMCFSINHMVHTVTFDNHIVTITWNTSITWLVVTLLKYAEGF